MTEQPSCGGTREVLHLQAIRSLILVLPDFYFVCLDVCIIKRMLCLYTICMLGTYDGQKMVSDPLGLKLQMTVSCHVGVGNWNLGLLDE